MSCVCAKRKTAECILPSLYPRNRCLPPHSDRRPRAPQSGGRRSCKRNCSRMCGLTSSFCDLKKTKQKRTRVAIIKAAIKQTFTAALVTLRDRLSRTLRATFPFIEIHQPDKQMAKANAVRYCSPAIYRTI